MSLRNLGLQDAYRSDRNHLARDFYVPCLREATSYDRAVGYFTSSSLATAARGLEAFLGRQGMMRIVASPQLTEEDAADIAAGYEYRAIIERALARDLAVDAEADPRTRARLGLLGRLIADGRLELKIAFVMRDGRAGIYHEKLGIFRDDEGDVVTFSGSSNETSSAYLANFESFEVYRSWLVEDERRAKRIAMDFEALWADTTEHLRVLDFPDVPKQDLIALGRELPANLDDIIGLDIPPDASYGGQAAGYGEPSLPEGLDLRSYQREAIRAWFSNNGRGTWKMATGTGKTITALAALTFVWRSITNQSPQGRLITIVLCPQIHLADQWAEEARRFGIHPIICLGSRHDWMIQLESALAGVESRSFNFVMAIVVNATLIGPAFQSVFRESGAPLMLIADEVHNVGAPKLRNLLPDSADFRLGLSATPERWFDEEGTAAIGEYFGDVVFELGLESALARGALSPYRYYPVLIELDDDEYARYRELTAKIGKLVGAGESELGPEEPGTSPDLKMLLLQRARLLGLASGKIPALLGELRTRRDSWFQLIYCAEGGDAHSGSRQVDAALRISGRELGLATALYTYETSRTARQGILRRFSAGDDLRVLVSMRCLDEGVDIPDARVAYLLASTTNPRQFIQRRGRILRRAPGKERAEIFDFVVVPPQEVGVDDSAFNIERRLLRRELMRVIEFARIAQNGPQAMQTLLALRRRYNLLDM